MTRTTMTLGVAAVLLFACPTAAEAQADILTDANNWTDFTPGHEMLNRVFRVGPPPPVFPPPPVTFRFNHPGLLDFVVPLSSLGFAGFFVGPEACDGLTEVFQSSPLVGITTGLPYSLAPPITAFWGTLHCIVGSRMFDPDASQAVTAFSTSLTQIVAPPVQVFRLRPAPGPGPGGSVPRVDGPAPAGAVSPLLAADNRRFDSNGDGINDVIIWQDTPGLLNVATGPPGFFPFSAPPVILARDNQLLFQTLTLHYQIRSLCINIITGVPGVVHHSVSGVTFGNSMLLTIGHGLSPLPDPTVGSVGVFAATPPISPPNPAIIAAAVANGPRNAGLTELERIFP